MMFQVHDHSLCAYVNSVNSEAMSQKKVATEIRAQPED